MPGGAQMRAGVVLALALCCATAVAAVVAHRPSSSRRDLRRAPQHALSANVPRDVLDARTLRAVRRAVKATQSDADKIIDYVVNGPGSGLVYGRLANFTDTIGNRVCGSPQLDAAVDYMLSELKADGLDNVHGETVTIPHWIRGAESIAMLSPRWHPMHMLSLGGSIGTGGKNLTAQALVVETFDELNAAAKAGLSQGKIIVFNEQCDWAAQPIDCYGTAVAYRGQGANAAHAAGGVAALVRSVTGFSIASPHTGMLDGKPSPVPAASITVEDAEMLARLQARNIPITLSIVMNAQNVADAPGQNVVAELTGSVWPEQVVLVSGHLDSWDVGQGAMDDGGGMAISYLALTVMKRLGIVPKRTLRAVLWSCEEFGGIGAQQYYDLHKVNISSMDIVMESDLGVFKPYGIQFAGNAQATAMMQQVGTLLERINCSAITGGADGTDIGPWMSAGVPGASLANENDAYFDFHHSDGDTMTVMDSDFLDLGVATWAVTALGVANLDTMLPR